MMQQAIVLSVLILCCGCSRNTPGFGGGHDVSVKPEDAFRLFAGLDPSASVPVGVKDLQGNGAAWMDFNVCCRFTAPQKVIDSIISNGYQKIQWDTIKPDMFPGPYVDDFSPKWNPTGVMEKECYSKRVEQDHSIDILHLVVDRKQGLVYAVGVGIVHP